MTYRFSILFLLIFNTAMTQEINWIDWEDPKAEQVAELEDKKFLILWTWQECKGCVKFKKRLNDRASYINKHFYTIIVNCNDDTDCRKDIYPFVEFIHPNGYNKIQLSGGDIDDNTLDNIIRLKYEH